MCINIGIRSALDARRDPVPFLAFAGLRPGMKVLDMVLAAATAVTASQAKRRCCRRSDRRGPEPN